MLRYFEVLIQNRVNRQLVSCHSLDNQTCWLLGSNFSFYSYPQKVLDTIFTVLHTLVELHSFGDQLSVYMKYFKA